MTSVDPRAVVVPLNDRGTTVKVLGGGVLCAVLGLGGLIGGITGSIEGGRGAQITGIVVGGLFTLLGLFILVNVRKVARPRRFVLEPRGVRYEDTGGPSWAVAWPELSRVSLHVGYHRGRLSKGYRVRLQLVPADGFFGQRHPEMARYAGRYGGETGYGFPLGPDRSTIPPLDAGLRSYAGPAYGGVVDDGQILGFGYV